MNYQRSHKLTRGSPNPLQSSQPRMRKGIGSSQSTTRKKQKKLMSEQKQPSMSIEGLRPRLKTEVERYPASKISIDSKRQSESAKNQIKISRQFVIRTQNNLNKQKISNSRKSVQLPQLNPSKTSSKSYGPIKAYAANTHCGLYRAYNEDRIAISLNVDKDRNMHCFGIFDGHGGTVCVEFLSNSLFDLIVECQKTVKDLKKSVVECFKMIEARFLELARQRVPLEKSGSCAIVALILADTVYIANLGDSRAILIGRGGDVSQLSQDHKPSLSQQRQRIQEHGGKLYQTKFPVAGSNGETQLGPCRVWPGRLSVSRTIGDIEAKDVDLGGLPNVISCQPQICSFPVTPGTILFLACDGIYDRLSNDDVAKFVCQERLDKAVNPHQAAGKMIEDCMKEAMLRDSYDNLSAISIIF